MTGGIFVRQETEGFQFMPIMKLFIPATLHLKRMILIRGYGTNWKGR